MISLVQTAKVRGIKIVNITFSGSLYVYSLVRVYVHRKHTQMVYFKHQTPKNMTSLCEGGAKALERSVIPRILTF